MSVLQDESFVWFPGWGGNSYGLLPIVERLSSGMHYLIDPKSSDLENLNITDWVKEAFSKLPSGRKWHVMGFSMGGLLAQEFAKLFSSHVKSLHLLCTNTGAKDNPMALRPETLTRWFSTAKELSDPLERILRVCFTEESIQNGTYDQYISYLRQDENPVSPKITRAQHLTVLQYSSRDFIKSIILPTFVYVGKHDQVVPREASLELYNSIDGARLIELDGGHFCILEKVKDFENYLIQAIQSI
ncbi:alpha/beta hydrolase [bacterium]|nr:alpha/beta hydrolase [bacterium]